MSDPTDLLENAFAELKEAVLPYARLAGVDAAHATVRRRRRTRIALAAAVAVIVPVVAFTVLRQPAAVPNTSTPVLAPTSSTSTGSPRLQPLGTILASSMREGQVQVPTFGDSGCPVGSTRFHNGVWTGTPVDNVAPSAWFDLEAVGDVNGDGRGDLLVLIRCAATPTTRLSQVTAYTSDGSLIGQVVRAGATEDISALQVQSDGTVRVLVSRPGTRAWFTYGWTAGSFRQVGGPVSAPPVPRTALSVSVMPKQAPGTLTQLAVTVHNGGTASDYLAVTFNSTVPMIIDAPGWATFPAPVGCHAPTGCPWTMRLAPVPAGQSATGTFSVLFLAAGNGAGPVSVTVTGWRNDLGEQSNEDTTNSVTVPLS